MGSHWRRVVLTLAILAVPAVVWAANIGKWNTPTAQSTILSTQLDSLNNNTASAASSAVANQTNLDLYWDCTVHLGSLSPSAGAYLSVYILEATDDSTYPAPSDADLRQQTNGLLFTVALSTTASTTQDNVVRNVLIPPHSFKIKVDNQSGVQLPGTGNTLKCSPYNINNNG